MPSLRPSASQRRRQGVVRQLAALAASLVLVLAVVRLWPAGPTEPPDVTYRAEGQDAIQIEEIVPTRQERRPPPPPRPPVDVLLPPVETLEDVDLDFEPLDVNVVESDDTGTDDARQEGDAGSSAEGPQVETSPRPVRFVEPTYPDAARRRGVRARARVRVVVSDRGRVEEAEVVQWQLLDDDGNPTETVAEVGYGLEDQALTAARRWLFRPARVDGRPVRAETVLTFTFGG